MDLRTAEYIWIGGKEPTPQLRSKTRIIEVVDSVSIDIFPEWNFDGSSTDQAEGIDSDCILKPVRYVNDPLREEGSFLVLCEVYNTDGTPHETNSRFILRKILEAGASEQEPAFGFEQEYVMFDKDGVLGWPKEGEPGPQGPYYCGNGEGKVAGRELAEDHREACLEAGLLFYGINAEVMLGQWEFQIGYRGFNEEADTLKIADHHYIATWLLHRIGESYGIKINMENKPIKGDWNGSGCHTNFSTKDMRDASKGKETIKKVLENLEKKHQEHISVYGNKNDERLTGKHETCSINEFRSGASDRGASIRIPVSTTKNGYGYLEDRRPGANMDAYTVVSRILVTILDYDESLLKIEEKVHC
ncbi:MAG: glutamine synthetase beta-grasp domain-containing protein [bacterium]